MANIFLDANDTFTLSSTNTDDVIFGRAGGSETVILQGNPTGTTLDGNVEVVQISSAAAGTTLQVNATTGRLELVSGGTVFASFSGGLNQAVNMQFTDGNVTLTQTGANDFTVATPGSTTGAVTINTTTPQTGSAVTLGAETSTADDTPVVAGQTFVLDATDTSVVGSAGDDTFDGSLANSLDGRSIVDIGGTDTLNATLTAPLSNTTSVTGVENVNLNLNFFSGANTAIFATNISGATITGSSSKLGFDGEFNVNEAGDNNIVAGTNVTTLDVADLTTGTVNAGSASTVLISTDAATDTANVTVNGDVDLDVSNSTTLALTATAASSVTLVSVEAGTEVTVTGDATLLGGAVDLTALTITSSGGVNVTDVGAILDVENYTVSAIEVSTADKLKVTNADGQVFNLTAADADFDVAGTGATGSTVTVNVSADQANGFEVRVAGVETSSINLTAAVEGLAQLAIEGESTVTVAGDVTITKLTATSATDDTVTFTGSGNLDVTGDTTDVASLVSSALTGNLTFTQAANTDISVILGAGDDEITLKVEENNGIVVTGNGSNTVNAEDFDEGTLSVTGGTGSDIVNIGANFGLTSAGTVAVELGDGNDTLSLAAVGASTVAADFGLGIDTLSLVDTGVYKAGDFSVAGLEIIDMNGSATVGSALVSGQSYIIKGAGATSILTVEGSATTGVTIDISSLVLDQSIGDGVGLTVITGTATGVAVGDTIIGNALTVDVITLATNNTTSDTVDVRTSTETVLDELDEFTTAVDKITFGGPAGSASNYAESDLDSGANITVAAAITEAETLFNGTVLYAYIFNSDNGGGADTDAFLIYDADGDGTADNIVQLVGMTGDGTAFDLVDIA